MKREDKKNRERPEPKRTHPWACWQPGWLKSDRGNKALPDKRFRVVAR